MNWSTYIFMNAFKENRRFYSDFSMRRSYYEFSLSTSFTNKFIYIRDFVAWHIMPNITSQNLTHHVLPRMTQLLMP